MFQLTPYFGSTPTFALSRPLTVKPGYVIALNVPTWAPAFAVGLGNDEVWRSSRDPAHCDDVQQKAAQTTRGKTATYSCLYRTARLMYTVTFIPDPARHEPSGDQEERPAPRRLSAVTRSRGAGTRACGERYYRASMGPSAIEGEG